MDGSGRSRSDRSVAVVGASCRLPGGIDDLDALWQALREGRDLVTEVPADRFDVLRFVDPSMPRPGKSYTGAGGFLTDIRGFDADYFGIAPKEAVQMDPQQRILLELAAEACDDAGISPQELAGSDTAVFVGIADHSYGALQMLMTESVNAYTMSGAASSIAANRVSHFLDLRGPSLAVDTACSSSLVALVQACRTLLAGESRAALVGGVNLLLSPYHYVGFCQASMLSPTGRCRSFSAGADGYVRAEGGGMVLLKRLADAVADGDRIRAVIVDGASNSDGRTAGLALPRKESQESLLRQVYDRAGIDPDDIAYLEAHGTGTPVGDPVECEAIGRALGIRRTREPLPIGSVKSNLGHLEPASGIAGLLKALLVLQHGTIPPTLHATPPNPHVDFAALRLAPAVECRATAVGEQAVVGVNSFGFGGTNAHVILAAPPPAPAVAAPDGTRPFVISAASRQALIETARRTAGRLKAAGPGEFYDLAWTACRRRGRRAHAAAVLAADPADAAAQLSRLADTLAPPAAEGEHQERKGERGEDTGTADSPAVADHVAHGRIVFAFSGNGAQWAGMGADLLASDPVFAEAVESADKALFPHTCWSVASALADPDLASRLSDTAVAQPLLFAVQVAVVEVLRQRGVRPAAVVGHSVGEVAAAYTAGALTLEQAARV
ncbi:type I polyketide synthase, partial [Streptomyces morookaense]